ncbi:MAG TPA: hypothetical protein PKK96_16990 [Anaerolineales bacterium]|nr:hypothetical protein [Anaerolineales bacterium]HNS62696.1 hypothetical protein [Anaerolineales bacterium]
MTIAEILETVRFVVNPSGQKSAVMVDLDVWEEIVTMLEDHEDAEEMKQAKMVREETVPWDVAKKDLNLGE